MASLFMLVPNSEEGVALFMCAGTVLTPNIIVTAAHCFTGNAESSGLATNSIVFCLLLVNTPPHQLQYCCLPFLLTTPLS